MTDHPLIMPKLGQAMEYGAIAEWLAADGTVVRAGQAVASVESDKATFEIEATKSGVIHHLAGVGDEIPVGEPFAMIGEGAEAQTGGAYALPTDGPAAGAAAVQPAAPAAAAGAPAGVSADRPLASPRAKALAHRLGVDLLRVAAHRADGLIVAADVKALAAAGRPLASPKARAVAQSLNVDLGQVAAHRTDGLIVASDVEAAATRARPAPQATVAAAPAAEAGVALTRLQRVAADRLSRSWAQAPHIVQMVEVDAAQLASASTALREAGGRGTLNDLLIKAAADCLARFPALNARFAGDRLVPLGEVAIGLAVATDAGLTVPVVRGADQLNLGEIAARTRELISAARSGRLSGGQVGGAGLTISNLGAYGIAFGTPVLNLDEPILVFVGAMEERPIVRDGQVVVGYRTTLSIAYDHRVVDGLAAARFSRALKTRLETVAELLPGPATPPAPALADRELRVSSQADALAVQVRSARHAWTVDEPAAVGGRDAGPDPVTLVLGGLASCMVIAFKLAARRRKVPLGEVRAHLTANPEGKLTGAAIRLEAWSSAPEVDVRKLLAPAKATCLVHDMLRPDLPITIDLDVHPAAD
ncbi:2-oxo acid dehydrogenase subunit E2 [uncultured Phenylobacterium sp.]|uniref:2-oxo acid dehydrogenase subunit E2 n=1 Tax=uncultured Phenylobacterium sp. TaxID=349273 RepID=UPI0025F432C4|nr:2-oxo acid dehydrogenase subunit E2 [uncultured Phenylobacterium sp.]